jgi:two-component system phosphate regulon sensor histidine kinase PhoR
MSIALAGLIAVQGYWIKNAIDIANEKFDKDVAEALLMTVTRIEKEETKDAVVKKFLDEDELIIFNSDSSLSHKEIKGKNKNNFVWTYSPHPERHIEVNNSGDSAEASLFITFEEDIDEDDEKDPDEINIKKKYVIRRQVDSLLDRKSNVVREVVTELLTLSENISLIERLNESEIDSFLSDALNSKSISADFEFAVKSSEPDTFIFANEIEETEFLIDSPYKARLFPHEVFTEPGYLVIHFPGRTGYLLGNMASVLLISLLVIVAIIFLYYKTVNILLRQKRLSEIKSDLINNITHEFKTPISTISLASEALNEPGLMKEKDSIKKYSGIIGEETFRLGKMVESLLNTAALEKNQFKLEKSIVDVHKIITEIIEKIMLINGNSNSVIKTELKSERPEINADPMHIRNIINNLLDNAVKYSSEKPEIVINTISAAEGIQITVQDNGPGISKHHQKRIFDSFYRVPTGDRHDVKGYGIGLSYVKKIIEAHNGTIKVESEQGRGTAFKIFLPYE